MINGEKETGVTFFKLDDSIDGGDIIAQDSFIIEYEDTIKDVYDKATIKSINILLNTLPKISEIEFKKQDKSKLEIYDKRIPQDGKINWNNKAIDLYNFIRAQSVPYPCAFSSINGVVIKIISCRISRIDSNKYRVGEIVLGDDVLVASRDYFLEILLIDDGKMIQEFKDYIKINKLLIGIDRCIME